MHRSNKLGAEQRASNDQSKLTRRSFSTPANLAELRESYSSGRIVEELKEVVRGNIGMSANSTNGVCPHRYHCIQNCLVKGFIRTFSAAYLTKFTTVAISSLFGGRLKPFGVDKQGRVFSEQLSKIALNPDHSKFAFWISIMAAAYRAILCLLRRRFQKDERWMHAIAGFLSASAIYLDEESRMKTFSMYLSVRALGDSLRKWHADGKIPLSDEQVSNFRVGIFAATQVIIMTAYAHDIDIIDRKYYKWISGMGNMDQQVNEVVYNTYDSFVPCQPMVHRGSCTAHLLQDWVSGLFRALKIYIPVHFLPQLLFDFKTVLADPQKFLARKSMNTIYSSLMLSTYVLGAKAPVCYLRNLFQKQTPLWTAIGGFFAGLSLLIEHPKRHTELVLYVIPRALEIVLRKIDSPVFRSRLFSLFSFQCTIALWMYLRNSDNGECHINSLNKAVIRCVFGTAGQV